jgi:DNA repair exonuclease SbcCD ATPase subunit
MPFDQEILERLERLETERNRAERVDQAREQMRLDRENPKAQGWTGEIQRAQDLALQARRDAVAKRDQEFALELDRTAGERAKLREKIDQITADRETIVEQHVRAVETYQQRLADFNRKCAPLQQRLGRMETPPEPPAPDYRASNRAYLDATHLSGIAGVAESRRNLEHALPRARTRREQAGIRARIAKLDGLIAGAGGLDDLDSPLAA